MKFYNSAGECVDYGSVAEYVATLSEEEKGLYNDIVEESQNREARLEESRRYSDIAKNRLTESCNKLGESFNKLEGKVNFFVRRNGI